MRRLGKCEQKVLQVRPRLSRIAVHEAHLETFLDEVRVPQLLIIPNYEPAGLKADHTYSFLSFLSLQGPLILNFYGF